MFRGLNRKPVKYTGVLIALVGLLLSACAAEEPVHYSVQSLDNAYQKGNFQQVIEEADYLVNMGPSSTQYAEARLYRGLAELCKEGNTELAKANLAVAEDLSTSLGTINQEYELTLLYRGQMVVNLHFGDMTAAERYYKQALQLSPDMQEVIIQEYVSGYLSNVVQTASR
ncbi:MAG: hypothetical protein JXB38_18965 [Anaerolineales bacterium]|nr:hypothetical protein [Anaerolineales bacterium]